MRVCGRIKGLSQKSLKDAGTAQKSTLRPRGRIVGSDGAQIAAWAATNTSVAAMLSGTFCQPAPKAQQLATAGTAHMQYAVHILGLVLRNILI